MPLEQKLPSPGPDATPLSVDSPFKPDLRFLPNRAWDDGQQRYPQVATYDPNNPTRQSLQELVARTTALDQGMPVPAHLEPTTEIPLVLDSQPSGEGISGAGENQNEASRRLSLLGRTAIRLGLRHSDTDLKYFGGLIDLEPELQKWDSIHSAEKKAQTLRTDAIELESSARQLLDTPQSGFRYTGVDGAIQQHRAELYVHRATVLDGKARLRRQGFEPRKYPSGERVGRRLRHAGKAIALHGARIFEAGADATIYALERRAVTLQERADTRIKPRALRFTAAHYTSAQAQEFRARAEVLKKVAKRTRGAATQRRERWYGSPRGTGRSPFLPQPQVRQAWPAPQANQARDGASPNSTKANGWSAPTVQST